jgi:DNA-binding protein H-NS
MERKPFETMSVEELWRLHTIVNDILAVRLAAKKEDLERRLRLLNPKDRNQNN